MEIKKLTLSFHSQSTVLAVGAEMKRGFAVLINGEAFVAAGNEPLGDLEALEVQIREIRSLLSDLRLDPEKVAIDSHPLYLSRKIAEDFDLPVIEVQHHRAHISSLLAEAGETGKVIGISMDGTGYGDDGAIWGGEFFVGDMFELERVGHIKYFFLQGGDRAAKETWRPALAVLDRIAPEVSEKIAKQLGDRAIMVLSAIRKGLAGVFSSSAGRIFDGAAFLILGIKENSFEAEAPISLERSAEKNERAYKFDISVENGGILLDPAPVFLEIIEDERPPSLKAYSFHYGLAKGIIEVVRILRDRFSINKVAMSGGVFQNKLLTGILREGLKEEGFYPLFHERLPAHDGNIALGQAVIASRR